MIILLAHGRILYLVIGLFMSHDFCLSRRLDRISSSSCHELVNVSTSSHHKTLTNYYFVWEPLLRGK